jgi:hypothetical protein
VFTDANSIDLSFGRSLEVETAEKIGICVKSLDVVVVYINNSVFNLRSKLFI